MKLFLLKMIFKTAFFLSALVMGGNTIYLSPHQGCKAPAEKQGAFIEMSLGTTTRISMGNDCNFL